MPFSSILYENQITALVVVFISCDTFVLINYELTSADDFRKQKWEDASSPFISDGCPLTHTFSSTFTYVRKYKTMRHSSFTVTLHVWNSWLD